MEDVLAMMIPIMALSVPVAWIVFSGLAKVARERAAAMQGGGEEMRHRLDALEDELGAMRDETRVLREELMETQERLDFAERLLAQPKGQGQR